MGEDHQLQAWETRQELLEFAVASGYQLSGTQLSRLHRAGLIPRPVIRAQGRGHGKASFYRPGTRDRLAAVLGARKEGRSFADIHWRLWWRGGGEASPAVRDRLSRVGREWAEEQERLADLLRGEEAGEPFATAQMDEHYRSISEDRAPAGLAKARRNVGRAQFATVFRVLADVGGGGFSGYPENRDPSEASPEFLVERALGIDRARSERVAGAGPWFEGDSAQDLKRLSERASSQAREDPGAIPDSRLDEARVEIQAFKTTILEVTPPLEQLLGSGALGLGVLATLLGEQSPDEEAWMLLIWISLRADPDLREGMRGFLGVAGEARALRELFDSVAILRSKVPALAEVMSDEAMVAALRDERSAQILNEELAAVYKAHGAEIEECIERHPQIEFALALWEAA